MEKNRKIIHIDMDAYYASIEQLDNPALKDKPLIVGGEPQSRGVVAACSYEARRYGIHSAMPCARAAALCPEAVFIRPRMARYREISQRLMAIFRSYTERVEPLSLDEAFLDVTSNSRNISSGTLLAREICKEIYLQLGLTASAGVSFNKFIAKVASDCQKPNGITTVTPSQALAFLGKLPIRKFFGVGEVTERKMHELGIRTGVDLRQCDEEMLVFHFGKTGSFLYRIARGIDNRPVETHRERKSLGSETTLAKDTVDLSEIHGIINELAASISLSLSKKNIGGCTLTLKVRYDDFTTITRSITSRVPFFSLADMMALLPPLIASTQIGMRPVRLLGLSVSKLLPHTPRPRQLPLPFPPVCGTTI